MSKILVEIFYMFVIMILYVCIVFKDSDLVVNSVVVFMNIVVVAIFKNIAFFRVVFFNRFMDEKFVVFM